jgi:hypothetical protein
LVKVAPTGKVSAVVAVAARVCVGGAVVAVGAGVDVDGTTVAVGAGGV